MKFSAALVLSFTIPVFPPLCLAEAAIPQNYKQRIVSFIEAKKPQSRQFAIDYEKPVSVLVGDSKKERLAVRCYWTPRNTLMIIESVFLFDGDSISEAARDEKIEWVDGKPGLEKKKPNLEGSDSPERESGPRLNKP